MSIRAIQNDIGESESFWKMSQLILIFFAVSTPLEWYNWRFVFQFNILCFLKFEIKGKVLKISSDFKNMICCQRGSRMFVKISGIPSEVNMVDFGLHCPGRKYRLL